MYQPKVEDTEQYSDSQGEHVICKGKLILVNPKNPYDALRHEGNKVKLLTIDSKKVKPIIISETEQIEKGDKVLDDENKIVTSQINSNPENYKDVWKGKVLALPEHFSDKHLQAIVDGKMKDGDEVLVKCKYETTPEGTPFDDWYEINLDQQNHITLFPAKQSIELDGLQSIQLAIIANAEDTDKAKEICNYLRDYVFDIKFSIKGEELNSAKQSLEEAAKDFANKDYRGGSDDYIDGFLRGAEWAKKNLS